MKSIAAKLGALQCRIIDAETNGKPELAVVLCHGFGAPGADLAPLASELLAEEPRLHGKVQFYFPAAPLELTSWGLHDARAWWMIDVRKYEQALERGELADLRQDTPRGLPEARRALMGVLDEIQRSTHLDLGHMVLGGFSQGAMLAMDVALRLEEPPAALLSFSGALLCEREWKARAANRRGLPVLISHGRQDGVLPFVGSEWLKEMCEQAGMDVQWHPFDGEHTIDRVALRAAGHLLGHLRMLDG